MIIMIKLEKNLKTLLMIIYKMDLFTLLILEIEMKIHNQYLKHIEIVIQEIINYTIGYHFTTWMNFWN